MSKKYTLEVGGEIPRFKGLLVAMESFYQL